MAHHLGRAPYSLHRLDLDTSGVVCFAKDKQAARSLSQQLRQREWQKRYWALCEIGETARQGLAPGDRFEVDPGPLASNPNPGFLTLTLTLTLIGTVVRLTPG